MPHPRKAHDDDRSSQPVHGVGLHVDEIDALTRLVRESKRAPERPAPRSPWRAPLHLLWRLLARLGSLFGA